VSRRLLIEADGGSRGNPGPAGYGAVVRDADTGEVLAEGAGGLGTATNNVAEYRGLIAGLEAAVALDPAAAVEVRMDSKLVVEQMAGRWQVKHPAMRPLALEAAALARRFAGGVRWTWVPRARNGHADRLANEAMDAQAEGRIWQAAGPVEVEAPEASAAPRISGWTPPTMRPTTTLVIRHGQTAHSAEKRFSGRSDPALTALGERQAAAVSRRLATRRGVVLAAVVTSPLQRARQTAAAVVSATGSPPVVVEERLRETDFGDWEGLTFAEVQQEWPDHVKQWLASPEVAPPGGESVADTMARVRAVRDDLQTDYAEGTVVVVTHVTPVKALAMLAGDLPLSALLRLHIDLCSLTTLEWYADGPAVLRGVNDTGHLEGLVG
jgi:probable phosphoglycerate mutase